MQNGYFNGSQELDARVVHQLRENAGWFMALGIALIALGMAAVIFAFQSTLLSVLYLGSFLLVVGFFEAVKAFKVNAWSAMFLHIALALLYILSGAFLVYNPAVNALTLTLVLAGFFVISGILKIFFAMTHKAPHAGWLILNGILGIVLGLLIWQQWPFSGLWVIGTIVGIDAIMTGFTWVMLSSAAKDLTPRDMGPRNGQNHVQ